MISNITHRILRTVALDISNAFDKVWHMGLLLKLSSYGFTGKFFSVIMSFLTDRSMNVTVNFQFSES